MTSCEQFEILSTVSNYHILGFPSHNDPNKVTIPNVSHHKYIATLELKCYAPASLRNSIVYFIKSSKIEKLGFLLHFLNKTDKYEIDWLFYSSVWYALVRVSFTVLTKSLCFSFELMVVWWGLDMLESRLLCKVSEFRSELWSSIWDDNFRNAIFTE